MFECWIEKIKVQSIYFPKRLCVILAEGLLSSGYEVEVEPVYVQVQVQVEQVRTPVQVQIRQFLK